MNNEEPSKSSDIKSHLREDLLESILKHGREPIFITDKDGIILDLSTAAALLTGYPAEELLHKYYLKAFNFRKEDDVGLVYPGFIEEAVQRGAHTSDRNHTVLIRKDLLQVPITFSALPLKKDGSIEGCLVIIQDMTKERKVDRMKTDFVSIASHELRTPLTAINGLISMIREGEYGPVNENLRKPLDDVILSSVRLIHLVNNLLNDSRIEGGRQMYNLTEFSLPQVIREIVQFLEPLVKDRPIQIQLGHLDDVYVQGDEDKVKQLLNNLLGNSLKFTDKGLITIYTKLNAELVEIYIQDTGIGIAPEDQPKLFGKFQQIDSSIGRPPGTGLGLHISRDIAQKLGGNVWLEHSAPQVGSTFVFSIPKAGSSLAEKVHNTLKSEVE